MMRFARMPVPRSSVNPALLRGPSLTAAPAVNLDSLTTAPTTPEKKEDGIGDFIKKLLARFATGGG